MKLMIVLKHPNIDVIADVDDEIVELDRCVPDVTNFTEYKNVAIVQWLGECVKIIPFKAAKNLAMPIPLFNIAMIFEVDEDLAGIHTLEMEKYKNDPKPFLSQEQFNEKMKEKKETLAKTLGK